MDVCDIDRVQLDDRAESSPKALWLLNIQLRVYFLSLLTKVRYLIFVSNFFCIEFFFVSSFKIGYALT